MDEADRLLDLGFQASVNTILSYLPRQRRTGLFSATQTRQVEVLIRAGLRNPVLVSVTEKATTNTPESLTNYYIITRNDGKLVTLLNFLQNNVIQKALLFLPTCAAVDYWSEILPNIISKKTLPVFALHGKMKHKRPNILKNFINSERGLLLCTDVLARGIDIEEVDWVLQWDPPASAASFVHRVGRTARQGKQGSSLILLLENEAAYVHFIEKNQRVTLQKWNDNNVTEEEILILLQKLRRLQENDRSLMEKATKAFVSHIRAYSKHECSLLLRVKVLFLLLLLVAHF